MGWIQTIIESEYKKHLILEWARIAEAKIITELKDRGLLKDCIDVNKFNNIDYAYEVSKECFENSPKFKISRSKIKMKTKD